MTPQEALINGREFLKTHKWGKKEYHQNGKYCAIGALFAGTFGENYWEEGAGDQRESVAIVYEAQNYLSTATGTGITTFNDNIAKRKRDVISIFNKAIKLAEGAE